MVGKRAAKAVARGAVTDGGGSTLSAVEEVSGEDEGAMEAACVVADDDEADYDDSLARDAFHRVEELEQYGISAIDVKKLREGGFYTVESIWMANMKDLVAVRGLSEAKVEKMRAACRNVSCMDTFQTAAAAWVARQRLVKVTTGSTALDAMLGGGIESQSITEVHGEFRSGKSQLAHMLCVTAQLRPEDGGGAGKALFIDTEGTFRPERIIQIAERFGIDPHDVLENIVLRRCYNHEMQMAALVDAAERLAEERFAVVIVDSLMALFRVDYQGRGELAVRQQKLNVHLSQYV